MSMIYSLIILTLWIIFWGYWLVSAFGAKKNVYSPKRTIGRAIRTLLVILLLVLVLIPGVYNTLQRYIAIPNNSVVDIVGVLFCAVGMAFAIWARIHLGRNWGMPMSVKENPQLVTSGPYQFVRHPIYTGILLATFGTMLVMGFLWLIIFIFFCIEFFYSATTEEKLMTEQFPEQYPPYKQKTKMLVPFVF